jgi:hypothetical protein
MDKRPLSLSNVIYPDVLGAITGGGRVSTEYLQYAVGIFPVHVYVNQPLELFIVVQSMVNVKLQCKVDIRLPSSDRSGQKITLETPKLSVVTTLQPAEAGLLRIPVVARPPTKTGTRFPILVKITPNVARGAKVVRPADGGPPPSVVELSPFRLQALREVTFETRVINDMVKVYLDLNAQTLPAEKAPLQVHYETLWAEQHIEEEKRAAQSKTQEAQRIVLAGEHGSAYPLLYQATGEKFNARGFPLHHGEARAIAKMMAYTLEEAPSLEAGYRLNEQHWFKRLCQVMASDELIVKNMMLDEITVKYLYEALAYDSILLAFGMVRPRTKEDLGSHDEQVQYATRVFKWLVGQGEGDLTYVYLPLVLGGVITDRMVTLKEPDSPWELLDQLREAARLRQRTLKGEATVVFKILEKLLLESENQLHYAGYRRY